jgi:hypothetical protein
MYVPSFSLIILALLPHVVCGSMKENVSTTSYNTMHMALALITDYGKYYRTSAMG